MSKKKMLTLTKSKRNLTLAQTLRLTQTQGRSREKGRKKTFTSCLESGTRGSL